ncbi:UNVERIFIED_CONTAM: Arrestin-like protein [Trichonephila clavipes]
MLKEVCTKAINILKSNHGLPCLFFYSLPEDQEKDPFGIILSYSIKVKLILGALGGEVVSELPFVLMNSGNGKMLVGENTTLMGNRELSSETTQPLNKKEA